MGEGWLIVSSYVEMGGIVDIGFKFLEIIL